MSMKSRIGACIIFCGVLLASCTHPPEAVPSAPAAYTPAAMPANPEVSPSPTPGMTMLVPLVTNIPPALPGIPSPDPTITINPLQLFFPTIIPAEGAEYRPPLYTVPWALTPNDHFYFSAPIAATYPGDPVWDYRYGGTYVDFGPDVIHTGIDLPAPRGAEVLAAGPGTVVWAGIGLFSGSQYNLKDPYGQAVAIRHDFGYKGLPLFSVYAHMEEVDVVIGQWLDTGNVVGHVGTTGMTTGPHLHFEVRLGENDFWQTRNPELWIAPPQGYGVLVGRVMSTANNLLYSYKVYLKSYATKKQYDGQDLC